ncbi:MAG: hypothetical protein Tsb0013_01390 [Phycisphaerales bacterium]
MGLPVSQVSVHDEVEEAGGWRYRVLVGADERPCEVRLSWVDYEHWARGVYPPARVVEALVRFLIDRDGEGSVRPRFDAASVRRMHPTVDTELPAML